MDSYYLIPATCGAVDNIGDNLQRDIGAVVELIIPEEFHDILIATVDKLVGAAIDDIKTSATYPFREALDSLVSDFSNLEEETGQTISELEDKLSWEHATVEELNLQIEQLEEQLEKEVSDG